MLRKITNLTLKTSLPLFPSRTSYRTLVRPAGRRRRVRRDGARQTRLADRVTVARGDVGA